LLCAWSNKTKLHKTNYETRWLYIFNAVDFKDIFYFVLPFFDYLHKKQLNTINQNYEEILMMKNWNKIQKMRKLKMIPWSIWQKSLIKSTLRKKFSRKKVSVFLKGHNHLLFILTALNLTVIFFKFFPWILFKRART
jgi:hypothetical protein